MLPRKRIFVGALIGALLLIFPLRVALGMVSAPVQAAFVGGFVWSGRLLDARIAGLPLGDVAMGLSPLDLLIGRAKFWIKGRFEGAVVSSFTGCGADVKALSLPLTRPIGPVTLTQLDVNDASVRFSGKQCRSASGRLQLTFAATPLTAGQVGRYSGEIRCDGDALASSLSSQSAMERVVIRIAGDGRYTASVIIRAQDEVMIQSLRAAGFRETAAGYSSQVSGTL